MSHEAVVIWCVVQAAAVAFLGLVAAWLMGRRGPGAAATAAAGAAATILVLTMCAPVRLPRVAWFDGFVNDGRVQDLVAPVVNVGAQSEDGAKPQATGAIDFRGLAAWVGDKIRLVEGRAAPQTADGSRDFVLWIVGAGALLGVLRFLASWRYVVRLKRASTLVGDAATAEMFAETARTLGVRRPVELRETSRLTSAAVVGWRRPAVLLPTDRADWSGDELRAALAHELAHVARNDFAWRFAASLAAAVHFVNPLVHMLAQRLALVQELAADRLAASAAGGAANYLRAISELAVRLDDPRIIDQTRLRAEPIVMPAFSSHLVRRIVMLRSKEGSAREGRRSVAGVLAAAVIAVIGAGTLAVRGSAEDVAPTEQPIGQSQSDSLQLFARQPLDPASLRRPDAGLMVIRLAEMSERPALVPLIKVLNRSAQEAWRELLGVDEAPEIHLDAIEYIAGTPTMTLKAKTAEEKGQFMLGCEEFMIRFREPVAWKSWTLAHVLEAKEVTDDGFEYVALPTFAGLGGLNFCVAARDERTLVLSANVDRLRDLAANESPAQPSALTAKWGSLDGGLAAFSAPVKLKDASAPASDDAPQAADPAALASDPAAAVMQAICLNVQELGGGFDLAAADSQSAVRISLTCADKAKAEQLKTSFEAFRPLAKAYLQAISVGLVKVVRVEGEGDAPMVRTEGTDDTQRETAQWYLALLGSSAIELEPRNDGRVDVRIEAQGKFPASVVEMYEMAEKVEGPKAVK